MAIYVPIVMYALRLFNKNALFTELLTLGVHAQRGLRYLVCVSVCVSVTQHLTFDVIIRVKNKNNLLSGG